MPMLAPEEYLAQVLEGLSPLEPVEVPLHQAHGRVLAYDVTARLPVPPWTGSAMDGYAVRARDTAEASPGSPVRMPVAGDVPAGTAPPPLEPGTAQRIMTGAVLPDGADAVVRVEDTDQLPGPRPLPETVEVRSAAAAGANVRQAGEDVTAGAPVLAAGTVLSAAGVAALASVGLGSVSVVPQVRVAVVSTGAELCDVGQELAPGAVPDSNGLLLAGLVAEHGARCASATRSGDDAEELVGHLRRVARHADLVVTSGGVSAGAFDPLSALDSTRTGCSGPDAGGADPAGPTPGSPPPSRPEADPVPADPAPVRLRRSAVAMQPGKPQGHGWVRAGDGREVPLVCLPGNPVSVLVSFTTLVVPVLARLGGYDSGRPAEQDGPPPGGSDTSCPDTSCPDTSRPAGHRAASEPAGRPGAQAGAVPVAALPGRARAATGWTAPRGRRQYVPVRLVAPPPAAASSPPQETAPDRAHQPQQADLADTRQAAGAAGTAWVSPTHRLGSGSHLVASLPTAQALAVVGADTAEVTEVTVGDELALLPLPGPPAPVRAGLPRGQADGVPPESRPPGAGPQGRTQTPRADSPGPEDPRDPRDSRQVVLTHLDEAGAARMVDVTGKEPSVRQARATALVTCSAPVVQALRTGSVPKGDVLAVARVAGIAAAKKVPDLLPLAHVIGVHGCQVDLEVTEEGVRVEATVRTADRTGVEMEALTAVTVAGLAVVDMVKGVDRDVALRDARVVAKSGGRSGDWTRPGGTGNGTGSTEDTEDTGGAKDTEGTGGSQDGQNSQDSRRGQNSRDSRDSQDGRCGSS